MILEAGELDTRIVLQRRSSKRDSYGETTDNWQDIGTFWGNIKSVTNRNINLAKGFAATVNYEAKIRYRSEVNNDCRAVIRGQIYNVSGVIHDPKKDWTQLFLSLLTN